MTHSRNDPPKWAELTHPKILAENNPGQNDPAETTHGRNDPDSKATQNRWDSTTHINMNHY